MKDFTLKTEEKESLYQLYLYAFNRQDSPERRKFFMDRIEHGKVFRVKDDNKVVSGLYRLPFELNLGGQLFQMGGIGDVMTYPEYGGRGYATQLLKTALQDMNEEGYELSFLAPFSQRYYRRLGYEQVESQFTYSIQAEKLKPVKVNTQLRVERTALADSLDEIADYYEKNVAILDGKINRQPWWWHYLTLKNPWNVVKVYRQDELDGYAIYEIQGMNLIIHEMSYQNYDTYQSILNFITADSSMVNNFVFKDFGNAYHGYFSSEPGELDVHVEPYMMGRIVNFEKFIDKYQFDQEFGEILIKVTDDILDSNNGIWKINSENVSLSSEERWQIKGKINDLSALFLGQISFEEAVRLQRIVIQDISEVQIKQFDAAIKKDILGFSDYF